WNVITDFATDIQDEIEKIQIEETIENEEELEKKEEKNLEITDDVLQMLEEKSKKSLRYKRSFFVRMVSDPKIYNPKIVRSLPSTSKRRHTTSETTEEENLSVNSPTIDHDNLAKMLQQTNLKEFFSKVEAKYKFINKTTSDLSDRLLASAFLNNVRREEELIQ
ncbi:hypothetical protein OTU49_004510, partial [Cherax quadricarinatus]